MTQRRIRTALASFGMSGRVFHAPLLFHHPAYQLARIVQRSAGDAAVLYPGVTLTRTFDEILDDSSIDLVIVNTPDGTHYDLTLKALGAGKHVVVEKPFTQSLRQADELISLARSRGRVLSVFHNRRWDGDFLTVRNILAGGVLGRLVEYESHIDRYRPQIVRQSWKEQAGSGAGLVWNLGSHLIDQALVLFGTPEAVSATTAILREGGEVDDWFSLRLHYPSIQVSLNSSYLASSPRPRFLLFGEAGAFVKYGIDPQEEALKRGSIPRSPGWGCDVEEYHGWLQINDHGSVRSDRVTTLPGDYPAYYDSVAAAIGGKGVPAVRAEEAADVIRVITSAYESARLSGARVPLTPAARNESR